ncbi:MAG: LamG domain-containing protein [Nanoarchaeota archaeon]|nr:LamG domain-containing protein [Nanoarchaeota archaeon]
MVSNKIVISFVVLFSIVISLSFVLAPPPNACTPWPECKDGADPSEEPEENNIADFFETCDDLSKWTVTSKWTDSRGECSAKNTDAEHFMTTTSGIDLSGKINPTLTYDYHIDNADSGEFMRVYLSDDGINFIQVAEYVGNEAGSEIIDIESFILLNSNVMIRASCFVSSNNEDCNLDNIKIESTPPLSTNPKVVIVSPIEGNYANNDFPLNFHVILDRIGNVIYTLNGVINKTMSSSDGLNFFDTLSSLADGSYLFSIIADDGDGNINDTESVTFNVDRTFPIANFIPPTPENNSTINGPIFVSLSSSDANDFYSFVNFDNDLLLWLRMDDVSGNTVIDLSGESNNGVIVGDTHQVQNGRFGEAFDFDGINDGGTTDAINLSGFQTKYPGVFNSSFTAIAWIKANKVAKMAPFGTKSITNWPGWHFRTGGGNILKFGVNTGYDDVSGTSATVETTNPIEADVWIHMVGVYDQMVPSISLYLNGTLIGTRTADVSSTGYANDQWLAVGSQEDPTKAWDGLVDEVMIFSRALGDSEIAALYDSSASQYEHTFEVSSESHLFKGFVVDGAGNVAETESRLVNIV